MKRSWPNFKVMSQHLSGESEKNHEKSQSGQSVSGPRFEPGTSRIRRRSVNHSTTTFGRRYLKFAEFYKKFWEELIRLLSLHKSFI
jgi:hypothetical protein